MASTITLESSVCISSIPEATRTYQEYATKCRVANQIIKSSFMNAGLDLSKAEIDGLISSQPTLWIKLNDDYPIYKITEGMKKAYNGLRMRLGRNPGIKEILKCIDSDISLERYL